MTVVSGIGIRVKGWVARNARRATRFLARQIDPNGTGFTGFQPAIAGPAMNGANIPTVRVPDQKAPDVRVLQNANNGGDPVAGKSGAQQVSQPVREKAVDSELKSYAKSRRTGKILGAIALAVGVSGVTAAYTGLNLLMFGVVSPSLALSLGPILGLSLGIFAALGVISTSKTIPNDKLNGRYSKQVNEDLRDYADSRWFKKTGIVSGLAFGTIIGIPEGGFIALQASGLLSVPTVIHVATGVITIGVIFGLIVPCAIKMKPPKELVEKYQGQDLPDIFTALHPGAARALERRI